MTNDPSTAQQSEEKDGRTPEDISSHWQIQLELSDKQHREWIKDGRKVVERYKSEKATAQAKRAGRKLNILFSNTEVLRAALYGRAAKPDVRRRFADPDPVAREAAEIIERGLIYCGETYDVDKPIEQAILDYTLPGRGVVRVEYEPIIKQRPTIDPMTGQPALDETGLPVLEDFIADQKLRERYIFWEDFRCSPARNWDGVNWVAFRHTMSRAELRENNFDDPHAIPLNWQPDVENKKQIPESLKKAEVWEIWDAETRKRYWIVKGYKVPCRIDDDPYGLESFFPLPEPLASYQTTDSIIPEPEFHAYQDQADDLDEIVARISRLTRALKRRGVYDQSIKELRRLSNAGDNEFIPVENYQALTSKGGLQAAFQSEDISVIAKVLLELYKQRDMLIQAIYEVMGIADIMRGASDPNETLGAQELKAQFGSTRMKRRQRAVQKWIRDLYKLKAEIMAEHFEPQVLQEMTGVQVTPEVMQLLRTDKLRSYRIDIETDSTVFEDEQKEQAAVVDLVKAVSEFIKVWGPIVSEQPALMPLAFELLTFAVRRFKAGRTLEDTIEQAKAALIQSAQQPKPDPEVQKAEAEMQRDQQKHNLDMQGKATDLQVTQAKAGFEMQQLQARQQAAMQAAMMPQPQTIQ